MSKQVFANGREISAKKDGNRSLAAMADVCLSPPSPPAGPVPIPYPNFAFASDTADGSKTVKIGGSEVGLKNQSCYKTSKGDEAATRTLGMGVVSHTIQGKMKHAAWSMDVKIEGANAIRHLDLTTHNHINTDNLAVTADTATQMPPPTEADCEELKRKIDNERRRLSGEHQLASLQEVATGRHTMTSAQFRKGDKKVTMLAASRHVDALGKEGYSKGLTTEQQDKDETNINCKEAKERNFRYKGKGAQGHATHTEARLIETAMKEHGAGRMMMSISWLKVNEGGRNKVLDYPCAACRRTICAAMLCGMEIVLCTRTDNKPNKQDVSKCPNDLSGGLTTAERESMKESAKHAPKTT